MIPKVSPRLFSLVCLTRDPITADELHVVVVSLYFPLVQHSPWPVFAFMTLGFSKAVFCNVPQSRFALFPRVNIWEKYCRYFQ